MTVLQMPQANKRANSLVGGDTPFKEPNWCQHWCARTVYDDQGPYFWGGNGRAWAINFWLGAVSRGKVVKTSDPSKIPAGAMTFSKGASQYGHVFIADGKGGCYTTDYPVSRKIGHVPIKQLMTAWGQTLLGYVEVTGAGTDYRGTSTAPVQTVTVWDQLSYNVARERWFTEWDTREHLIADSIRGDASVNCFQEAHEPEQIMSLMKALGGNFQRVEGPSGLEIMFDKTRWDLLDVEIWKLNIQNRALMEVQLKRIQTGRVVRIANTHAPAGSPALRDQYGNKVDDYIRTTDVLCGDFNTGSNSLSPRKQIRAKGFRDMREQCDVKNEGMAEFPTKGKWLADIYSRPDRKVKITYGELHLTPAKASDHRELTARIEAR